MTPPLRKLPDDSPCWCVDYQPETGHSPRCESQRALAGVKGEKPAALDSPRVQEQKRMRTLAMQAAFLSAYSELALISPAAKAADVSHSTVLAWEKGDPAFAAQMQVAREEAYDKLEREAMRRATQGVERPVFQGGQWVGSEQVYSDTLMTLLLKGNRPRKFRENISAELSGVNGGAIEHQQVFTDLDDHERAVLRKVLEEAIQAQLKIEAETQ